MKVQLSNNVKAVLKEASSRINEMPLEQRLIHWKGVSELTPEESSIGQLARHNAIVVEQSLKLQSNFLNALAET